MVVADRGFDIKSSVGLLCSRLEIPAFAKNKKQLDAISIEQTRNIANVERVIGNVRQKYSLLHATQPIDFVVSINNEETTLHKIVHVSCAIINICDLIVPFE